jgi:hypothetical protein
MRRFIGSWGREARTSRSQAAQPPARTPVQPPAASLPPGVVDVETETRLALTVLEDTARRRFVDLQMAVEPLLVAQVDINDCQACLRELLAAAINRADSGVLITARRQGDHVNIEILDDCGSAPAAIHLPEPKCVPNGATVTAEYQPQHGAKVSLRLPYPLIDAAGDAEAWTLAVD